MKLMSHSPRAISVRLYVTVVSLLVTVLALATALVRLVVTLISGLTTFLERRWGKAPKATQTPEAIQATGRPNLRIVPAPSSATMQLTTGLTQLGFHPKNVRAFVDGLGTRVDQEPLPTLIKLGLRALAPTTLAVS